MKWFQRQQTVSKLPNGVSEREAELLSAYLDGQLSKAEQQQLELRLKQSPALQTLLSELRLTRTLLRSQPLLRALGMTSVERRLPYCRSNAASIACDGATTAAALCSPAMTRSR